MVAFALFKILFEPNCLAKIFFIPASSRTVRTDPPAITPVPGDAGRSIKLHAPYADFITCGIESLIVNGTLIKFFFPFNALISDNKLHGILYKSSNIVDNTILNDTGESFRSITLP